MYKLDIHGGSPLSGSIKTSGSKNATLPIFFASILADGPLKLSNTPQLSDVSTTLRLLMDIGSNFVLEEDGSIFIDSSKLTHLVAEYALVKTMRASILTLGPMLTKYKEAKISLPGGCAIGTRPVNLHLDALEKMGATIEVKNGYIYAKAKELVGAQINFDLISVTATENIIMAATLAKGITTINNAAQEPEVTDLIRCLKKMGAKIEVKNQRFESGEPCADLVVKQSELKGVELSGEIIPNIIDEIPILSIAAAFAEGETLIREASELRVKESDRLQAVSDGFRMLGIAHKNFDDGMSILGSSKRLRIEQPIFIESHDDHRIAMSFLIAGLKCTKPITVKNCENIFTSFPNFIELISSIGYKLEK